jgi:hypothetical protein
MAMEVREMFGLYGGAPRHVHGSCIAGCERRRRERSDVRRPDDCIAVADSGAPGKRPAMEAAGA